MNASVAMLFVVAAVVAIGDWIAVGLKSKKLEYIAKPLTMLSLVAVALAIEPVNTTQRVVVVTALLLSMVGDIFLMLRNEDMFVFGLGAFLMAHVAYIVGFEFRGVTLGALIVGALVVAVALGALAPRIVAAVKQADRTMVVPVQAYMVVISVMVVFAFGTRGALAVAGAGCFYASDALIAWNRFVTTHRYGPMAIITTYHVGQALLVASLI